MPKTVATQALLQDLKRLNQRLSEITLHDFTILDIEQLHWREATHKWSIIECVAHLNYVADFYLPPTLKAVEHAQRKASRPQENFTRGYWGHRLVSKVRLRSNNFPKKNIESSKKYTPTTSVNQQLDAQKIFEDFATHQQTKARILDIAPQINIEKTRVYALFFNLVSINLGDMLKMLIYHDERHVVQAQRILYHDHFQGNTSLDVLLSTHG
ncbi:MAG: DinB family protein [Aureispira sp.]